MSTHLFQIGDIVRINEPTLKQWAEIRTRGFHAVEIAPYIGYLAVVVETRNSGEAVSDACVLRTCDEDYVFDPNGPFEGADILTIGSHLTLIQESPLRTMIVGQDSLTGLYGYPLPMAGSNLQRDVIAPELDAVSSGTIPNGSIVEAIRISHHRVSRCPNPQMEVYIDCRVTIYENDEPLRYIPNRYADGQEVIVPIPVSAFVLGFTTF